MKYPFWLRCIQDSQFRSTNPVPGTRSRRRRRFRRTHFERLEDRRVLAGGSLVGIDFGEGDSSPINWTQIASFSQAGNLFENLLAEDESNTPFDLSLSTSAPSADPFGTSIIASTLPSHTQSLAGLDNIVFPSDDRGSMHAVWSDLGAGNRFEVYVFGADSEVSETQRVTISGADVPVTFTQSLGTGELYINGEIGSNSRPLREFAQIITADEDGRISITVEKVSGISLALALKQAKPPTRFTDRA